MHRVVVGVGGNVALLNSGQKLPKRLLVHAELGDQIVLHKQRVAAHQQRVAVGPLPDLPACTIAMKTGIGLRER